MEHSVQVPSTEQQEAKPFYRNVTIALLMVLMMWTVMMVETFLTGSLSEYGLWPGELKGLPGILTMPFLHGDFDHLQSNTAGILITVIIGLQIYPKSFWRSFVLIYFLGHLLTWWFARGEAVHIGASGIIYGLWGFILMGAFVRRDRPSGGAALVVVLLFAGMIWGTLPIWIDKSWEGHLFGMLAGFLAAILFSKKDQIVTPPWPEELEAVEEDYLEFEDEEQPIEKYHSDPPSHAYQSDQQIQDPAWRHVLDQWEQDIQQERFRNRSPND